MRTSEKFNYVDFHFVCLGTNCDYHSEHGPTFLML